jgi:hypothetical protein
MTSEDRTKLALRLPKVKEPASRQQDVLEFVLAGIRQRCFTGNDQLLAAFHLNNVLVEIGYTTTEAATLGRFLQKTGLLFRTNNKEGGLYVWYVALPQQATQLPIEVLTAAWRQTRDDINTTARLKSLKDELEELKASGGSGSNKAKGGSSGDKAFMGKVAERVGVITDERDAALARVDALTREIETLQQKLDEQPEATQAALLTWLDKQARGKK